MSVKFNTCIKASIRRNMKGDKKNNTLEASFIFLGFFCEKELIIKRDPKDFLDHIVLLLKQTLH